MTSDCVVFCVFFNDSHNNLQISTKLWSETDKSVWPFLKTRTTLLLLLASSQLGPLQIPKTVEKYLKEVSQWHQPGDKSHRCIYPKQQILQKLGVTWEIIAPAKTLLQLRAPGILEPIINVEANFNGTSVAKEREPTISTHIKNVR